MHCQKLNVCDDVNVHCRYERNQPACGGKANFVAHVDQPTPLAPITHTCCEAIPSFEEGITESSSHEGNDCFIYELPDPNAPPPDSFEKENYIKNDEEDEHFTLLNSIDQLPKHLNPEGYHYRMRLFLLRYKSPPALLVKGIKRLREGYRVTICRPRCRRVVIEEDEPEEEKEEDNSLKNWITQKLTGIDSLKKPKTLMKSSTLEPLERTKVTTVVVDGGVFTTTNKEIGEENNKKNNLLPTTTLLTTPSTDSNSPLNISNADPLIKTPNNILINTNNNVTLIASGAGQHHNVYINNNNTVTLITVGGNGLLKGNNTVESKSNITVDNESNKTVKEEIKGMEKVLVEKEEKGDSEENKIKTTPGKEDREVVEDDKEEAKFQRVVNEINSREGKKLGENKNSGKDDSVKDSGKDAPRNGSVTFSGNSLKGKETNDSENERDSGTKVENNLTGSNKGNASGNAGINGRTNGEGDNLGNYSGKGLESRPFEDEGKVASSGKDYGKYSGNELPESNKNLIKQVSGKKDNEGINNNIVDSGDESEEEIKELKENSEKESKVNGVKNDGLLEKTRGDEEENNSGLNGKGRVKERIENERGRVPEQKGKFDKGRRGEEKKVGRGRVPEEGKDGRLTEESERVPNDKEDFNRRGLKKVEEDKGKEEDEEGKVVGEDKLQSGKIENGGSDRRKIFKEGKELNEGRGMGEKKVNGSEEGNEDKRRVGNKKEEGREENGRRRGKGKEGEGNGRGREEEERERIGELEGRRGKGKEGRGREENENRRGIATGRRGLDDDEQKGEVDNEEKGEGREANEKGGVKEFGRNEGNNLKNRRLKGGGINGREEIKENEGVEGTEGMKNLRGKGLEGNVANGREGREEEEGGRTEEGRTVEEGKGREEKEEKKESEERREEVKKEEKRRRDEKEEKKGREEEEGGSEDEKENLQNSSAIKKEGKSLKKILLEEHGGQAEKNREEDNENITVNSEENELNKHWRESIRRGNTTNNATEKPKTRNETLITPGVIIEPRTRPKTPGESLKHPKITTVLPTTTVTPSSPETSSTTTETLTTPAMTERVKDTNKDSTVPSTVTTTVDRAEEAKESSGENEPPNQNPHSVQYTEPIKQQQHPTPADSSPAFEELFGLSHKNCFSADTLVETANGVKRMDRLEVGELVLVPASGNSLKFERIEMFYHRKPDENTFFVLIETEEGKQLSLTPLHLLPYGNCSEMASGELDSDRIEKWMQKSRFAHKARVGDCVFTFNQQSNKNIKINIERIQKIGRRYSKGIYSPMTIEGALLTNGILSSCFSQIESHALQKLSFDILVSIYRLFGFLTDLIERTERIYFTEIPVPSLVDFLHTISEYFCI